MAGRDWAFNIKINSSALRQLTTVGDALLKATDALRQVRAMTGTAVSQIGDQMTQELNSVKTSISALKSELEDVRKQAKISKEAVRTASKPQTERTNRTTGSSQSNNKQEITTPIVDELRQIKTILSSAKFMTGNDSLSGDSAERVARSVATTMMSQFQRMERLLAARQDQRYSERGQSSPPAGAKTGNTTVIVPGGKRMAVPGTFDLKAAQTTGLLDRVFNVIGAQKQEFSDFQNDQRAAFVKTIDRIKTALVTSTQFKPHQINSLIQGLEEHLLSPARLKPENAAYNFITDRTLRKFTESGSITKAAQATTFAKESSNERAQSASFKNLAKIITMRAGTIGDFSLNPAMSGDDQSGTGVASMMSRQIMQGLLRGISPEISRAQAHDLWSSVSGANLLAQKPFPTALPHERLVQVQARMTKVNQASGEGGQTQAADVYQHGENVAATDDVDREVAMKDMLNVLNQQLPKIRRKFMASVVENAGIDTSDLPLNSLQEVGIQTGMNSIFSKMAEQFKGLKGDPVKQAQQLFDATKGDINMPDVADSVNTLLGKIFDDQAPKIKNASFDNLYKSIAQIETYVSSQINSLTKTSETKKDAEASQQAQQTTNVRTDVYGQGRMFDIYNAIRQQIGSTQKDNGQKAGIEPEALSATLIGTLAEDVNAGKFDPTKQGELWNYFKKNYYEQFQNLTQQALGGVPANMEGHLRQHLLPEFMKSYNAPYAEYTGENVLDQYNQTIPPLRLAAEQQGQAGGFAFEIVDELKIANTRLTQIENHLQTLITKSLGPAGGAITEASLPNIGGRSGGIMGRVYGFIDDVSENFRRLTGSGPDLKEAFRSQKPDISQVYDRYGLRPPGQFRQPSLGERFGSAATYTALYSTAGSMVYTGVNAARNAVGSMANNETAMTSVRRVLSPLTVDVRTLSEESRRLGDTYGQSVAEVSTAMRSFATGNKDFSTIVKGTEASLVAVNATTISLEEAINGIISAQQQYKISTNDTMRIVNAWSTVENATGYNAREMAKAMQIAGMQAKNVGVDFNAFVGIVGAVGEATRREGQAIGSNMKFMFEHIRDDKAIQALRSVGIESTNIAGDFRSVIDIVSNLSSKWNTLSDAQKQNIGVSVAGNYQMNDFLVMMDKWPRAMELTSESIKNQDSAMKSNQLAMATLTKQVDQLKSSYEGLWDSIGQSGVLTTVKTVVDALREALSLFGKLNDLTGGLAGGAAGTAGFATLALGGMSFFGNNVLPGALSARHRQEVYPQGAAMEIAIAQQISADAIKEAAKARAKVPQQVANRLVQPGIQETAMASGIMPVGGRLTNHPILTGVMAMTGASLVNAGYDQYLRTGTDTAPSAADTAVHTATSLAMNYGMMNMIRKGGSDVGFFRGQGTIRQVALVAMAAMAAMQSYGVIRQYIQGRNAANTPASTPANTQNNNTQDDFQAGVLSASPEKLSRLVSEYAKAIDRFTNKNDEMIKSVDFVSKSMQMANFTPNGEGVAGAMMMVQNSTRMNKALLDLDKGDSGFINPLQTGGNRSMQDQLEELIGDVMRRSNESMGIGLNGQMNLYRNVAVQPLSFRNEASQILDSFIRAGGSATGTQGSAAYKRLEGLVGVDAANRYQGQVGRINALRGGSEEDRAQADREEQAMRDRFLRETKIDSGDATGKLRGSIQNMAGAYQTQIQQIMQGMAVQYRYQRRTGQVSGIDEFMAANGGQLSADIQAMIKNLDSAQNAAKEIAQEIARIDPKSDEIGRLNLLIDQLNASAQALGTTGQNTAGRIEMMVDGLEQLTNEASSIEALASAMGGAFGQTGVNASQETINELLRQIASKQEEANRNPAARPMLLEIISRLSTSVVAQEKIQRDTQRQREILQKGFSTSVLSRQLNIGMGMDAGGGARPLAESLQQQVSELNQRIARITAPAFEGRSPDESAAFAQQLQVIMGDLSGRMRDLSIAMNSSYQKNYVLADQSSRNMADYVREQISKGATGEEIFSDPYMRMAAQQEGLFSDLLSMSLENDLQRRVADNSDAIVRLLQDNGGMMKSVFDAINNMLQASGRPQITQEQFKSQVIGSHAAGTMFQAGTKNVDTMGRISKDETLARLHKGEIVLNKQQADELLKNHYATGTNPNLKMNPDYGTSRFMKLIQHGGERINLSSLPQDTLQLLNAPQNTLTGDKTKILVNDAIDILKSRSGKIGMSAEGIDELLKNINIKIGGVSGGHSAQLIPWKLRVGQTVGIASNPQIRLAHVMSQPGMYAQRLAGTLAQELTHAAHPLLLTDVSKLPLPFTPEQMAMRAKFLESTAGLSQSGDYISQLGLSRLHTGYQNVPEGSPLRYSEFIGNTNQAGLFSAFGVRRKQRGYNAFMEKASNELYAALRSGKLTPQEAAQKFAELWSRGVDVMGGNRVPLSTRMRGMIPQWSIGNDLSVAGKALGAGGRSLGSAALWGMSRFMQPSDLFREDLPRLMGSMRDMKPQFMAELHDVMGIGSRIYNESPSFERMFMMGMNGLRKSGPWALGATANALTAPIGWGINAAGSINNKLRGIDLSSIIARGGMLDNAYYRSVDAISSLRGTNIFAGGRNALGSFGRFIGNRGAPIANLGLLAADLGGQYAANKFGFGGGWSEHVQPAIGGLWQMQQAGLVASGKGLTGFNLLNRAGNLASSYGWSRAGNALRAGEGLLSNSVMRGAGRTLGAYEAIRLGTRIGGSVGAYAWGNDAWSSKNLNQTRTGLNEATDSIYTLIGSAFSDNMNAQVQQTRAGSQMLHEMIYNSMRNDGRYGEGTYTNNRMDDMKARTASFFARAVSGDTAREMIEQARRQLDVDSNIQLQELLNTPLLLLAGAQGQTGSGESGHAPADYAKNVAAKAEERRNQIEQTLQQYKAMMQQNGSLDSPEAKAAIDTMTQQIKDQADRVQMLKNIAATGSNKVTSSAGKYTMNDVLAYANSLPSDELHKQMSYGAKKAFVALQGMSQFNFKTTPDARNAWAEKISGMPGTTRVLDLLNMVGGTNFNNAMSMTESMGINVASTDDKMIAARSAFQKKFLDPFNDVKRAGEFAPSKLASDAGMDAEYSAQEAIRNVESFKSALDELNNSNLIANHRKNAENATKEATQLLADLGYSYTGKPDVSIIEAKRKLWAQQYGPLAGQFANIQSSEDLINSLVGKMTSTWPSLPESVRNRYGVGSPNELINGYSDYMPAHQLMMLMNQLSQWDVGALADMDRWNKARTSIDEAKRLMNEERNKNSIPLVRRSFDQIDGKYVTVASSDGQQWTTDIKKVSEEVARQQAAEQQRVGLNREVSRSFRDRTMTEKYDSMDSYWNKVREFDPVLVRAAKDYLALKDQFETLKKADQTPERDAELEALKTAMATLSRDKYDNYYTQDTLEQFAANAQFTRTQLENQNVMMQRHSGGPTIASNEMVIQGSGREWILPSQKVNEFTDSAGELQTMLANKYNMDPMTIDARQFMGGSAEEKNYNHIHEGNVTLTMDAGMQSLLEQVVALLQGNSGGANVTPARQGDRIPRPYEG